MDGNDTTVLSDPDYVNQQYFIKKDEQKSSPNTCGPRMIIICLVVQALAFGICLIVLIAYVSNATTPSTNISQANSQMLQDQTSAKEAIETLTNQLAEAMTMVKSNEEKNLSLVASCNESRVSTCGNISCIPRTFVNRGH